MPERIDRFQGEFHFLSNFYRGGGCLPTVEHQFQAHKAATVHDAIWVMAAPTPREAKQRGREVDRRPDWEEVKHALMLDLVRAKFSDDDLRGRLLDTGDAELVEGNTWGDTEWGVCNGVGENRLGKILMEVRAEIAGDAEGGPDGP
jgi:hypothetical protein